MFLKYGVAIMLNTFLGPGVGQLFLKKIKKGFAILAIALLLLIIMSVVLMSSVEPSSVPADFSSMKIFAKEIIAQNAGKLKVMNYALMILWAYSYADIIMSAVEERKKNAAK
jgi:TM2 domain-containing membrane protein YozV